MSEFSPRDFRTYLRWAKKRIKRLEEIYDGKGSPIHQDIASLVKTVKLLSWAIEDLAKRAEPVLGLKEGEEAKEVKG